VFLDNDIVLDDHQKTAKTPGVYYHGIAIRQILAVAILYYFGDVAPKLAL